MKPPAKIQQGTLALMVPRALDFLARPRGYVIARCIEQISADQPALNQETAHPLRLRLEPEGASAREWGASENDRRARSYRITLAGRKQLQTEFRGCQQTADIVARFPAINAETQSCSC